MPRDRVPSPWVEFLDDIDRALSGPVDLHCLGGFVVNVCYGQRRATADVDVVSVVPGRRLDEILRIAGKGSTITRKHRLYIDYVTVATIPESYEERLRGVFDGRFRNLRLYALDPYDLALAKLERNLDVDRDDVRFLGVTVPLDVTLLRQRYLRELRPFLASPTREDLTLDLWAAMIQEARQEAALPAKSNLPDARYSSERASTREAEESIDEQLRFAIANKRLIQLGYAGRLRVVEPHDYGVHKRTTMLLACQRRESAEMQRPSGQSWRLFDVSKIESYSVLDETFQGSRGEAHRHHHTWNVLYARVT